MSTIHQIYCTHCTHGTSALERREGELADRMLGYSARAGSLEARELRRYYRQIERYVYYYLPRDTPSEEKLRLTASLAPQRLVYHPSAGGLQVVAQVCYRQTDTQGRPGSYFAHVLFRDQRDNQPAWSQLDCLKLWAAPGWVEEDSPGLPFLLPPLGSLGQLLAGRRPAVDDQVFLSFLSTPAGGSFDDPAGVIPERWRRTDAGQRCGLFLAAFGGFLEITGTRGESLLLVIEPSVAALVFYGILRLLPVGGIRERVSFSTFEANTDRVGTSLAATSFCDPNKTDLRADAYRSRGFVINTFSGRRSESRRAEAQYARTMVRRLLEEGWGAVDSSLSDLQSAGARRTEDLDALAAVDNLVPALLDPRHPPLANDWRRSPMTRGYLRQALARRLSGLTNPIASLEPILGKPGHLTILELIAAEPAVPGTRAVADFLLARLPGDRIAELLKLEGVSSEAKVDALVRYVTAQGDLPPGCDHLWNEPSRTVGPRARDKAPLLVQVLARLDVNTLESFYQRVASQHSDAFLMSLFGAWKCQQAPRDGLTRVVQAVDDRALLSLFRTQGAVFFKEYPDDDPALGAKLHEMLGSLVEQVRQFPERLDVIVAGRHLLPDDDQDVVTAWINVRRAIVDVGRLQDQKSGILRQPPLEELEAACKRLAQEARKAMPPGRLDDDPKGARKQTCLRQIGKRLLGGKPLLPHGTWQHDALWQKIAWYFQNRTWPSAALRKMSPRSRSLGPLAVFLVVLTTVTLLVVAVSAFLSSGRGKSGGITAGMGPERPTIETPQTLPRSESPQPGPAEQTLTPRIPGEEATPERIAAEQTESESEIADPATSRPDTPQQASTDDAPGLHVSPDRGQRDDPGETEGPIPREMAQQSQTPSAEAPASAVGERQAATEPDHPPPDDTSIADDDRWKAQAEEFAREHGGRFFDEQPLVDGELRIPAGALPASDAGGLFLGGGVLYFDQAMVPFGQGFNQRPPVSRHEVPQVANAFGFPSVYVELQSQAGAYAVALGVVPSSLPPDAEARKEEALDQLQRNARMVRAQLRAYNSRTATEKEKDAAFENIVALMRIEMPPVSPKPNRRSPEYLEHPEAYEAALERHERAAAARSRAKASVIPKAMAFASTVDQKQKLAESQFRQFEEQMRRGNQQGLAALKQQCRRISVLVYRAMASTEAAAPSSAAASAASRPAVGPASAAGAMESVDGRFQVDEKPAQRLNPPAIARIRPVVTGEGGRPLPSWYHEEIVTGCEITEENAAGLLLRSIRLQDVTVQKSTDLFEGAVAARIRLLFFSRSDQRSGQARQAPIVAASHAIERIEAGRQYTVTLQLSKETLDWLHLLAAEPDSNEPRL